MIKDSQFKKDLYLLKRTIKYFKKYKLNIVILLFTIVFTMIINVVQPLIMGEIIQDLTSTSFNTIGKSLLYLLCLYLMGCLFSFVKRYQTIYISNNLITDFKYAIHKKVLNLSMKVFDKVSTGEFISRIDGDISIAIHIIADQLLNFIVTFVNIIVLLIIMIRINWKLSIITAFTFPLIYFTFKIFGKMLRKKNEELTHINDKYYTCLSQSLNEVKYIKTLGVKENISNMFFKILISLKNKYISVATISMFSNNLMMLISSLNNLLVIAFGAHFVVSGTLTIQFLMAFTSYTNRFASDVSTLTTVNSDFQQLAVRLKRIFNILDNEGFEGEKFGFKEFVDNNIKFEHVYFSYEYGKEIMSDVSFDIEKPGVYILHGKNGCGKSTIFNLISGLYKVDKGNIKIGNIPLGEISEESLRKKIYIMHQQSFMFNCSIRDNFKLVKPEVKMDEIIKACRQVDMNGYIENLELKYDTIISENVSNLSGGQKQRLALAMCIVKDSPIILLDEVTSSLDKGSKEIIEEIIKEMSKNKIVIMITHDDLMIKNADKIISFKDNGQVVFDYNYSSFVSNI